MRAAHPLRVLTRHDPPHLQHPRPPRIHPHPAQDTSDSPHKQRLLAPKPCWVPRCGRLEFYVQPLSAHLQWRRTCQGLGFRLQGVQEIGILLPNNQRQHRTLHIQKDLLPYALCYLLCLPVIRVQDSGVTTIRR